MTSYGGMFLFLEKTLYFCLPKFLWSLFVPFSSFFRMAKSISLEKTENIDENNSNGE